MKIGGLQRGWWLGAGLILLLLGGCAVNPVTGQSQLMLLSEQDEIQLGIKTDQAVTEQYGEYDSPALQRYVSSIVLPIARLSHRPNLPWSVKVMDTPVVNAFAAPGGHVFVTRGLLAAVNDEAELAGVIGHEIGHVTARHSAQQYSQQMLAGLGVQLGQAVAGSFGDLVGPVLEAGTGLLFLKFSRDDERQADSLGVEYASRAGYDARHMADFFETLQRQQSLQGGSGGSLPEWFSTHPNPLDREASVRAQTADWQARLPQQQFRSNRDNYLNQIDGLVFGADPRQGFREGDWYYFPQHQVQFRIPSGWQFAREGNRIQMAHPQQRAAVAFGIEEQGSLDQVANAFVNALQARVLDSRLATVDGMPSKQLVCAVNQNGQQVRVLARFFLKSNRVFMFYGFCAEQDVNSFAALIEQPAESFGRLTDAAKLNRQPQRLAVVTVKKSQPLQAVLESYRVDNSLWAQVAWLNAMTLSSPVTAGQRVKLVR